MNENQVSRKTKQENENISVVVFLSHKIGGQNKLAKLLGVSKGAVSHYHTTGKLPTKHHKRIVELGFLSYEQLNTEPFTPPPSED